MDVRSDVKRQHPPGWYPARPGSTQLRWWDSTAWTEHYSTPPVRGAKGLAIASLCCFAPLVLILLPLAIAQAAGAHVVAEENADGHGFFLFPWSLLGAIVGLALAIVALVRGRRAARLLAAIGIVAALAAIAVIVFTGFGTTT